MSEAPNYLSVGAVFEWAWKCLVASGNALINLVSNLLEAGIELLCLSYDACSRIIDWASFGVSVVGLGMVACNYNQGS